MRRTWALLCLVLLLASPLVSFGETDEERKERLENQLRELDQQILEQQRKVETKQVERQTIERDLDLIEAEVSKAQLGIRARALAIEQLLGQIDEKADVIEILSERSIRQKQSLAELIRKTEEIDNFSLVELMLSNQNFSEFFADFESFRTINDSLSDSLKVLAELKVDTQQQVESLEDKKLAEAELKDMQEQQKAVIEAKEAEKEQILEVTKGEEAAYQAHLDAQQKTAAQLRQQLFELAGGGGQIQFTEAVSLAKFASSKTGVSASLILAILEQESAYGSNIGSCSYNEVVHDKAVMHPDRDQPVFKAIADVLGFDASTKLVSCPWIRSGERIGWGGAMGPSQFIPSTWAIYGGIVNSGGSWSYSQSSDAIRSLTGSSGPSNPFRNQDAFMATALLMRDNGAVAGNYNAEWTAAIRYFSGWAGASNPINHPYGDNVMARKQRIEGDIRVLDAG